MLHNRTLNPAVAEALKDVATFQRCWENFETLGKGVNNLGDGLWADIVAAVAFGGIVDDAELLLKRLEAHEAAAATAHGVKRERAARKGVAATDFVVPPTFKSYKSTIKGAIEHGVELLDANGVPRSRNDVQEDLKLAKHDDKSPEEKLGQAAATFLAIYGKCDQKHPLTVDAVNAVINKLQADGWLVTAVPAAA